MKNQLKVFDCFPNDEIIRGNILLDVVFEKGDDNIETFFAPLYDGGMVMMPLTETLFRLHLEKIDKFCVRRDCNCTKFQIGDEQNKGGAEIY